VIIRKGNDEKVFGDQLARKCDVEKVFGDQLVMNWDGADSTDRSYTRRGTDKKCNKMKKKSVVHYGSEFRSGDVFLNTYVYSSLPSTELCSCVLHLPEM
jgi:hypothetical protein